MHCFNHRDVPALALCKFCQKGVCAHCLTDAPSGVACSESCATKNHELDLMTERGLQLYGIGSRASRLPPTGVLMWAIIAVVAWGGTLFSYLTGDRWTGFAVFAVLATGLFALTIWSTRRTRLNC